MKRRVTFFLALAVCLATLPAWVLASPPVQEQVSGNLLADGDFEAPQPWPQQDGIGEVQVAPGWRAYYLDEPPAYVQIPSNCSDKPRQPQCWWMRPEFRDNTTFIDHLHSGERSQKYFSFGRMHEAGLLQQVGGIMPGARVRFSIWMQAWMCSNPDECGRSGEHSDQPTNMHLRVGIDPMGGTDPLTSTIAWSAERPAWDEWVQFTVETIAMTDTVTVFTHSRADWDWARNNNDVYVDDGSLVIVGAYITPTAVLTGTAAALATQTASVTPRRTATPTATGTPFPEGAITHTVETGNTLFDIALRYGLKVDSLLKLNRMTTQTQLYVGQPVVVQIVSVTATPTATGTPLPTGTPPPSPTASPSETPTLFPTATLAPAPPKTTSPSPWFLLAGGAVLAAGVAAGAIGIVMGLKRR